MAEERKRYTYYHNLQPHMNLPCLSLLIISFRYAVVTGANKGIGFEIVRQLASKGIVVVLTARDEKKGLEAVEKLKDYGLSDHVVFHQLDVSDPASTASLADFIKAKFGKLDILVNIIQSRFPYRVIYFPRSILLENLLEILLACFTWRN